MSIIKKMLKQKAVYWPYEGEDQFGKPQLGDPVEIKVRWEDVIATYLNAKGEEQQSEATVYVDRDVAVKGKLMLGALTSGFDPDPLTHLDAWEIMYSGKLPNFKATEFLRTVYLRRS